LSITVSDLDETLDFRLLSWCWNELRLGAVLMGRMYFIYKKDMDLEGQEVESYGLNVSHPKFRCCQYDSSKRWGAMVWM
jgi:hypothetical protein